MQKKTAEWLRENRRPRSAASTRSRQAAPRGHRGASTKTTDGDGAIHHPLHLRDKANKNINFGGNAIVRQRSVSVLNNINMAPEAISAAAAASSLPRLLSISYNVDSDIDDANENVETGNNGSVPFSADGMIIWYICFSVVVLVPFSICTSYCWYTRFSSHRRAQAALDQELHLEREQALSRIEANVQAFSVNESIRNTKRIRFALRNQIEKVSRADIKAARVLLCEKYDNECPSDLESGSQTSGAKNCDSKEISTESSEKSQSSGSEPRQGLHKFTLTSESCSICLERFVKGDMVAHASHHSSCSHVFHEDCVVTWFSKRPHEPYCPSCRQVFTSFPKYERGSAPSVTSNMTPQTSLESHEHFTSVMGATTNISPDIGVRDLFEADLEDPLDANNGDEEKDDSDENSDAVANSAATDGSLDHKDGAV